MVVEIIHDCVNLGPVVARAVSLLVAEDDGETEVALGVGVPSLFVTRHGDGLMSRSV